MHDVPAFSQERLARIAQMESWHFWFAGRRELVRRLLARWLPSGRVVEIGCGTGHLFEQMSGLTGAWVAALDQRPEGLARVRSERPDAPLVRADAAALPLASGACAAIVALDVLEHTDDRAVLAEVARVLSPGGTLILTVPALPWLWSARDEAAGHRRRYTRASLRRAVEHAGLQVVTVRWYQCLLLPLVAATRLAGRTSRRVLDAEDMPPRWGNAVLSAVSRFEVRAGDVVPWPIGSSLAAVCRKPIRPA